MSEVVTDLGANMSELTPRSLVVNGRATTQEELRAHADTILGGWPSSSSVECGMAAGILALLDLLEANQDLVEFLKEPGHSLSGSLERGLAQSEAGETVDLGDFSQYLDAGEPQS